MSDRVCAVCGDEAHPLWTRPLPFDWEFYLIAEHGLDPKIEEPMMPLCPGCGPEVNLLVSENKQLHQYTRLERERLTAERNELLDELSLDAVYSES